MNAQRSQHRQGTLDPERAVRLQGVRGWTWDPYDTDWEEGFTYLTRFAEREGHLRIPAQYREADGYRLGQWIDVQRQYFRKGKLDAERLARLEAVPGWAWDQNLADWEEGFDRLQRFIKREGHARVPQGWRDNGYRLGRWVMVQRQYFRKGMLAPDRQARLEAISDWTWDPYDTDWEEGFAYLQRFVEREGHARVPHGRRDNGFGLGNWVADQHHRYRRGTLDPKRRARLEALPGWTWDTQEATWDEGFAHLQRFVRREGHARVPSDWREDGYRLGQWVGVQRRGFKLGRLDSVRRERLETLPGWVWDRSEVEWEDGYARLRRFTKREGHSCVPQSYRDEDGFRLGSWVARNRQGQADGRLSERRARRLEALPGWTWDAREGRWEEGFDCLKRFVEREGHARVPPKHRENGVKLGHWVLTQRGACRRKTLAPDRRTRLEALPGWTWDAREGRWEEGFDCLKRFVEREGHARVPLGWREDGYRLGRWVQHQRGQLDAGRRKRLEALPGWVWDPQEADWEEGFGLLQRFVEREGHARVPAKHREGTFRLGQWVSVRRRQYQSGQLDPKRQDRLEALPGWTWDVLTADWEEWFARLQRFVDREGHARVPRDHREDGYRLGGWVKNRRRDYRRGTLEATRRARLEALPGWAWDFKKRPVKQEA